MNNPCKLCQKQPAINSHIFPRFAYKMYVADQAKGGQHVDLVNRPASNPRSNKQQKELFFCHNCDSELLGDSYGASLCQAIERSPLAAQEYTPDLLIFATSISLRFALQLQQDSKLTKGQRAILKVAIGNWKEILKNEGTYDSRPTSQHVFLLSPNDENLHRILFNRVSWAGNFMVTQLGPLHIIGILSRKGWAKQDIEVWEKSLVDVSGGTLKPTQEFLVDKEITHSLMRVLLDTQSYMVGKSRSIGQLP